MMMFLGIFLFCSAIYTRRFCSPDNVDRNFADFFSSISLILGYAFILVAVIDALVDIFI